MFILRHYVRLVTSVVRPVALLDLSEVDPSVDGPDRRDSQGQERFHLRAITHEWPHDVRSHANQVGERSRRSG